MRISSDLYAALKAALSKHFVSTREAYDVVCAVYAEHGRNKPGYVTSNIVRQVLVNGGSVQGHSEAERAERSSRWRERQAKSTDTVRNALAFQVRDDAMENGFRFPGTNLPRMTTNQMYDFILKVAPLLEAVQRLVKAAEPLLNTTVTTTHTERATTQAEPAAPAAAAVPIPVKYDIELTIVGVHSKHRHELHQAFPRARLHFIDPKSATDAAHLTTGRKCVICTQSINSQLVRRVKDVATSAVVLGSIRTVRDHIETALSNACAASFKKGQ